MQDEFMRIEKLGVIKKVEDLTDWRAPCIVVHKNSGSIKVCIDFKRLNKTVKREYHPLPAPDESLAVLGKSKVFSKLDANFVAIGRCGCILSPKFHSIYNLFWSVCVSEATFWNIQCARSIPETKAESTSGGRRCHLCQMNDILIHTQDVQSQEQKVRKVLGRLKEAGIALNEQKCEFFKTQVTLLGHIIDY